MKKKKYIEEMKGKLNQKINQESKIQFPISVF